MDHRLAVVRSASLEPESARPHSSASAPSLRSRNSVYLPSVRMPEPQGGGNVKVVVRVRKFLPRGAFCLPRKQISSSILTGKSEIERGAECLVQMDAGKEETTLLAPGTSDQANSKTFSRKIVEPKSFIFDKSFWSHDEEDTHYAHQEDIYNSLGEEMLDHNFEGYHTCVFAYGQTGSGKSYTMMGTPEQPGLIPRTCQDLFERIESNESPTVSYSVRVSYFEVYNEHVRDLLVPRTEPPNYLKIRESPSEGPYVKDLSDQPVRNYADIIRLMKSGDQSRTTASTKMNDTSSRSHAVFTIMLKQIHADVVTDETTERTARIRLVDLAGSERAKATEATGARLREGSNINKSLTTLGRVIAALADASSAQNSPKKRRAQPKEVVPYRDSILTWLLKDSLGGNSKTAMIACVAPSDYDETLSTLRYADQAKRIRTVATINQDTTSSAERDAQIMGMQETIRQLQLSLSQQQAKEASIAEKATTTHASAMKQATQNMKKEQEKQQAQLSEYSDQCERLNRLMEENRQVAECKIQALRTENEALRLHLKLALDSLKNPVVVPPFKEESLEHEPEVHEQENVDRRKSWLSDAGTEFDQDEMDAQAHRNATHELLHGELESFLQDLGMFRRKLGDDRGRWSKKQDGSKRTRFERAPMRELPL